MEIANFKALDWSEYRSYRYEADCNSRVCIFDRYLQYLTAVDSTDEADRYVDELERVRGG